MCNIDNDREFSTEATTKRAPSGVPDHDPAMMRRALEIFLPKDKEEFAELMLMSESRPLGNAYINRDGAETAVAQALDEEFDIAALRLNPVAKDVAVDKLPEANVFYNMVKDQSAKASDILRRDFLLIDCDPQRPAKTAATDSQHAAALEFARVVRAYLSEKGMGPTILADSGNGAHIVLPLAGLPADERHEQLCRSFLKALNAVFAPQADGVIVDSVTYDAPRLMRWPGTVNAKGPNTPERPHRSSALLDVPDDLQPITTERLEAVLKDLESRSDPGKGQSAGNVEVPKTAAKPNRESPAKPDMDRDHTRALLEEALPFVDPESRDVWLRVGMGLHAFDTDGALELWDQWSQGTSEKPCLKFEEGACARAWAGFKNRENGVTVGTIFKLAQDAGWDRRGSQARINGRKHTGSRNALDNPRILAERFIESCSHRPLRHYRGEWYRFDGQAYRRLKTYEAEAEVMGHLQSVDAASPKSPARLTSRATLANVLANLKSTSMLHLPSENEPPFWIHQNGTTPAPGWVALQNRIVNVPELGQTLADGSYVLDGLVAANSPKLFAVRSLPYDHNPTMNCPMWKNYVATALPDPADQAILRQMFALCLVPRTDYGVFFALIGNPGTGKSLAIKVLRALVGKENTCCVPLADLDGNFNARLMTESLLNVVDDLPTRGSVWVRNGEGVLKSIATGGIVPCERKGENREVGDDRPATARIVMASNRLPAFEDSSDALWQRLRILPFNEVFRGTDAQIPDLDELIIRDELPGIFTWAVAGFSELLKRKSFPESPQGLKIKEAHKRRCNPLLAFFEEKYPEGWPEEPVPVSYLNQRLENWCEANGYEPIKAPRLAAELEVRGGFKKTARYGSDKKPRKCFVFGKQTRK